MATPTLTSPGHVVEPDPLEALVPRLAFELDVATLPHHRSFEGSLISADISGFTAMSERLAERGRAGIEEITDTVNGCFTALITRAYDFGGEILKFGGDALFILMRGPGHQRRAADAATAMQRTLAGLEIGRRAQLGMSVGAASGLIDAYLVGGDEPELVIGGPTATHVVHLESAAGRGESLVCHDLAAALPAHMLVRSTDDGVIVDGATGDTEPGPPQRDFADVETRHHVPGDVVDSLDGFFNAGGEHRFVAAAFLLATGFGAVRAQGGPDRVAEALHDLVGSLKDACAETGAVVLHNDVAPDGVKFILAAGAPVNRGVPAEAIVGAALSIARIDSPFTLRQGLNLGRVFAGFVGSPFRRTYTLMGDTMNTAARLLGPAGDREVVATEALVLQTRTPLRTVRLEPLALKGKSEPTIAHRIDDVDPGEAMLSPVDVIGRDEELALLTRALSRPGTLTFVRGPAGVGKTALIEAAVAAVPDARVLRLPCTPYGSTTPYYSFRQRLRDILGVDRDADATHAGEQLTASVADRHTELSPWAPLLALTIDAAVPLTPEVEALDEQFITQRVHETVVALFDRAFSGPLLVALEDAQWIDDASADLLRTLVMAARQRPWTGLVTARPDVVWEPPADADVVGLALGPLSTTSIRELVLHHTGRPVTDADLDLLVERADGNPLFALEMARAVTDGPIAELPATVEELISVRIDRLPPAQRRTLRIASVFGRDFAIEDVRAISDEVVDVESDDMVERRSPGRFRFRHTLYRDTAYEGLTFQRRRQLHADVGQLIEQRAGGDDAEADLLSRHFAAAGDNAKTWHYAVTAGDHATSAYAYADAAAAYRRGLEASRRLREIRPAERSTIAEKLGDLYFELGRFAEAERTYARSRQLRHDPVDEGQLMRKIGSIRERQGRTKAALQWYRRAHEVIGSDAGPRQARAAHAQIALAQAGIFHRLGDNERCERLALDALDAARLAHDDATAALSLERIHLARVYLRRDSEHSGTDALAAHRARDDRSGIVRTSINLGIEAYFAGDWTTASERYLEAAAVAQSTGNAVLAGTAMLNSAEILSDQGHWARAAELLDDAIRNFDAIGYPVGASTAQVAAGVAEMRRGDLTAAHCWLDTAARNAQGADVSELDAELAIRSAELDLLDGGVSASSIASLIELAPRHHPMFGRVLRLRGLHLLHTGHIEDARSDFRTALEMTGGGVERALVLDALARCRPSDEAELRAARDELCERMDIVRLPPLLPNDLAERSSDQASNVTRMS